ncbi:MAG: hypothetical protein FWE22_00805 [Firmicutes bacterium]|nr:hypothetical protein [Bacillota bacterium]
MESGLIIALSSLSCGVIGLMVTLVTIIRKWLKEKKAKLTARAETAEEKMKAENAKLLAERLKVVTDAVAHAVTEVEQMKAETSGRIPAKVKRTMGIVMALDECIKANVQDVTREELGTMVDSLVDFTKTVNARDKDIVQRSVNFESVNG